MNNKREIKKYDERGNLTYYKYPNGDEYFKEYDENGNCIYFKDSDGYELWKEYDENGNCIHCKNSDGFEEWYDSNGNVINNMINIEIVSKKYELTEEEYNAIIDHLEEINNILIKARK